MTKPNDKITFLQVTTLETGGLDNSQTETVNGPLLVASRAVCRWATGSDGYGEWAVSLWPAVHEGKHCWLLEERWCAARGYTSEGTTESIIDLDAGIALAIEHGMIHHLFVGAT